MLETLRAKSDTTKRNISIVLTIVVFGAILFVWMSSWDARSNEESTLGKTASPVTSLTSMLDGFMMDIRDAVSGSPSFVKVNPTSTTTTASSTGNFDLSGVVIIDATSTH